MARRMRTWIAIVVGMVLGVRCGPPPGPEEPDDTSGWVSPEPGDALSFLGEQEWPPEPPEVYVGPFGAKGARPAALLDAEQKLEKKNYKQALAAFSAFAAAHPQSYWVPHATFRMARCHYQLSEYDQALDVLDALIEGEPGLVWEARAKVELSSLYHALPSSGYERGGRVYYNYEHHEGKYVYMYQRNRERAVALLEEARLAYLALLEADPGDRGTAPGDDLRLEAVDLDFLLLQDIGTLHWNRHDVCPPQPPLDPPAPDAAYDPRWSPREKTLFLLDEIPRLNEGRDDSHPAAWATFKKALFLMSYPECPPAGWLERVEQERDAWESALRERWEDEEGESAADVELGVILEDLDEPAYREPRWDPGPDLDPLALLEEALDRWPDDRHAELYDATRGRVLEGRGEYRAAEELYERFLEDHPDSVWTGDVRSSLFEMRAASLSASTLEISYRGRDARLHLDTRNVEEVEVAIHEVDLAHQMLRKKHLKKPHTHFRDMHDYFEKYKHAKKGMGKKVWSTDYVTKDRGDYRPVHGFVDLPQLPMGTYFIHAHAGDQDVILPWVKTDLVIVGKSVKDEMRYVVTDAISGAPLAGIPIVVKEVYEERSHGYKWKTVVEIKKTKTDADGRASYPLTLGDEVGYNRVEVLARKGDRIAFTNDVAGPYRYSSETGRTYRIFTVTDRPVYRPGDTIRFKHVVRAYEDGRNEHVEGLEIHMRVTDPKGDELIDETVEASAFGNAWGEIEVDEAAPLGIYHASAWVEGHRYRSHQSSGASFRVEEYKKPEFEVEVLPSASIASPGDDVKARVKATYYFGAPVAAARVSYKVFRSVFHHAYTPPNRWDWLYGPGFGIVHERPYSHGEDLVDEGEGITDDLGELLVALPRIEEDLDHDYTYRVVAEVTDLSRRVISGAGDLRVTREPYYCYLLPTRGFYTAGDTVESEIRAMTADDEPVPATGTVQVVRLEYPPGAEAVEIPVAEQQVELDSAGRAFFRFEAKREGQYRVSLTSTHGSGGPVTAERVISVAGAKLAAKHFEFSEVDVTSKRRTYLRGETIELLVTSPWPDATLWITYEGGDEVFHDELLETQGMGTVLEVEATDRLHPNFFVHVTAVRDGMVHTVTREVFIPPGEEVLDVSVTPDRDEYEPRDDGELAIEVRDHEGKPVRGELSVSVFDRSVLYIQSETTGDIRSYYYGDRRYHDVMEFHSTQVWFYGWSRDGTERPEFDVYGLPGVSGSFSGSHIGRASSYVCPSCERPGESPWRFTVPAMSESSQAQFPGQDVLTAVTGKGGGGGLGGMKVAEQAVMAEAEGEAREKAGGVMKKKAMPVGSAKAPPMGGEMADELDRAATDGAAPLVRSRFADTALWVPDVITGADGRAVVDVEWPDNLTTWAVRVTGVDGTSRVGLAHAEAVTTKKLVARIETPRFMVEGDAVTLAAVVHNDHDSEREVDLELTLTGGVEYAGGREATVIVPSGKDVRHDFEVRAVEASPVEVKLTAVTDDDSDALVKRLEVMTWGADKMVSRAAALRDSGTMTLELSLPAERREETTELVLALEPSVGGVVLRSLPYLVHYPYGCVEQTMSRFMPAAMVARTLKDLGVSLADIPQPPSEASLADPVGAAHGAPQTWQGAPIYDNDELDRIIRLGLKRLASFQHSDGGWSWWRDGPSDPYMTAYVVSGLWEARNAGYDVGSLMIPRGMGFLDRRYAKMRKRVEKKVGWDEVSPGERHLMTYLAYVLSLDGRVDMEDVQGIHDHREALGHYGRSLLALCLHNVGEESAAALVVSNLADVAWADDANGTASFKFEAKDHWRWYNNRVETVAWALRAFTAVDPSHRLGPMFARWLANNRTGNRWHSTRDTALATLALTDFMRVHDELDPDYDVTVKINGDPVLSYHQDRENLFAGEGRLVLRGDALDGDALRIEVRVDGEGALYANAFLSYFTKEKEIEGAGNEILVDRTYYRLKEVKKKVDTYYGEVTKIDYLRKPLEHGESVDSGELVEVKIMVESKNDYEYLVFEDFKPAGFEPIALKSGGVFEHGTWVNRELRDEKVVSFLYSLEQGKQAISYRMRAEIPGAFRVLPHRAWAMYAPRVQAISDSWHVSID